MSKSKDAAIKRDNNMEIWDAVSKTDPDHTKTVQYGRKFTAIDAHSQVMQATTMFGPVGAGWGYDTYFTTIDTPRGETFICCDLTLWWRSDAEWENIPMKSPKHKFGPVRGICVLQGIKADGKPKPSDHDAGKKAMTDALTKALSHLGFNADVFLGMFDDNKYVEERRKDKDAELSASQKEYEQTRNAFIEKIKSSTTAAEVDKVLADYKLWVDRLAPGKAVEIRAWAEQQKAEKE